MDRLHFVLMTSVLFTTPCVGRSFIVPTAFPKSTDSLTFNQQNAIRTEGYLPFKDAQIYQQIEIATAGLGQEIEELDEQAALDEAQQQVASGETQQQTAEPPANDGGSDNENNNGGGNNFGGVPEHDVASNNPPHHDDTSRVCTVYQPDIPAAQTLPLGHPLLKSDWNQKVSSSWFGYRWGGKDFHHGMDLACCGKQYYGKPVFSPADGTVSWVVRAGPGKSCGNGLSIKHANGLRTVYCHLKDAPLYKKGDLVAAGCQIGNVGHTGGRKIDAHPSMGIDLTHLHYEIHYNGSAKYITAPDSTKLPIVIGAKCKDCIDPTEWINYHYSK